MITDGAEILPKEDRDAAAIVRRQIEQDGVRIITGAKVERVTGKETGKNLSLPRRGSKTRRLECDAILVAVGRAPNLENLGLDEAGVRYTARGVDVDERLRTTNPRIFAAGDICSRYQVHPRRRRHGAHRHRQRAVHGAAQGDRSRHSLVYLYRSGDRARGLLRERRASGGFLLSETITEPLSHVDRAILDGESGRLCASSLR